MDTSSKLPERPSKPWKEEMLKKSQGYGLARMEATIDTHLDEAGWQEKYDKFKERREGQVDVEIRQNTYLIRTWGFAIPNLVVGVYHTGIEVIGLGEYSFDNEGIYRLTYDEVRDIEELDYTGCTSHRCTTNYNTIESAVEELRIEFPPGSYDITKKNCHHFCDALATRLGFPPLKRAYTRAARIYKPIEKSCQRASWFCLTTWSSLTSCFLSCIQSESQIQKYGLLLA